MEGEAIAEMNKGFELFCHEIKKDPVAKKRTEVAVITFGGSVELKIPFTEGRNLVPAAFAASGQTPMGGALKLAVREVSAQKQAYKDAGLEYFQPWLFIITDGAPTDTAEFDEAVTQIAELERAQGITVFSVLVGGSAEKDQLSRLSAIRPPISLKGLEFSSLFTWLSASMGAVANSRASGSNDAGIATAAAMNQNPLAPPGWASW